MPRVMPLRLWDSGQKGSLVGDILDPQPQGVGVWRTKDTVSIIPTLVFLPPFSAYESAGSCWEP